MDFSRLYREFNGMSHEIINLDGLRYSNWIALEITLMVGHDGFEPSTN